MALENISNVPEVCSESLLEHFIFKIFSSVPSTETPVASLWHCDPDPPWGKILDPPLLTHVKALQAGHSSQGTSEPITPASRPYQDVIGPSRLVIPACKRYDTRDHHDNRLCMCITRPYNAFLSRGHILRS